MSNDASSTTASLLGVLVVPGLAVHLRYTARDVVALARTSKRIVRSVNWIELSRQFRLFVAPTRRSGRPRRERAERPPAIPELPSSITGKAAEALILCGRLGDESARACWDFVKPGGRIVPWGHRTWSHRGLARYAGRRHYLAPTDDSYVAIACGHYHSAAIRCDSSIVCWGQELNGEYVGAPTGLSGFVAIACGNLINAALLYDGRIVGWGRGAFVDGVVAPPAGGGYVAIECGWGHAVALHADGHVVTFGATSDDSPDGADFVEIACGWQFSLALRKDGRIAVWGSNQKNQHSGAPAGPGYVAIAAGESHGVALHEEGHVVTWGSTRSLVPLPQGTSFIAIACGYERSVGLREDGAVSMWGSRTQYELLPGDRRHGYVAIASCTGQHVALDEGGHVVNLESGRRQRQERDYPAPTGTGFVAIACGDHFALGLRVEHTLSFQVKHALWQHWDQMCSFVADLMTRWC